MPYIGKKPADIIATAIDTTTGTFSGAFTSLGIDDNADALAMTIDSSENVLVSKTSSGIGTAGIELRSNNDVLITSSGDVALYLNRLSSDGSIAEFRKDGTVVGSIQSRAGAMLSIAFNPSGSDGAGFTGGSNAVLPANATALSDNAIDLGVGSYRYKDLYLSGGVRVGGTGAVNLLDDYEEGTWTPVLIGNSSAGSGTYTSQSARYTKIGRTVTFEFALGWSNHTGSGAMEIGGFPFNSGSQTYYVVQQEAITLTSNHVAFTARIESGSGQGVIIQCPVGGGNRAGIAIDTAGAINGSGTYQTS